MSVSVLTVFSALTTSRPVQPVVIPSCWPPVGFTSLSMICLLTTAEGILNCVRALGGYTDCSTADTAFDTDDYKEADYLKKVETTGSNVDLIMNWFVRVISCRPLLIPSKAQCIQGRGILLPWFLRRGCSAWIPSIRHSRTQPEVCVHSYIRGVANLVNSVIDTFGTACSSTVCLSLPACVRTMSWMTSGSAFYTRSTSTRNLSRGSSDTVTSVSCAHGPQMDLVWFGQQ